MSKNITCIIVDDEYQNRVVLEKMINLFCSNITVLGTAGSVDEAIKLINEVQPNLIFLDIEMPEKNGFQLMEEIEDPNFLVIFTTAHAEYAIKAIKYAAMDYLLKPISVEELKGAVDKAIEKLNNFSEESNHNKTKIAVLNENRKNMVAEFKKIILNTEDRIEIIGLNDIHWCESRENRTAFHFGKGESLEVKESLNTYENLLPTSEFIKVHQHYVVNKDFVKSLDDLVTFIILKDGKKIPIAKNLRTQVIKRLRVFP